jgi:hypothetical protein
MKTAIKRSCTAALMLFMMPLVTSCVSHQQLPGNWTLPAPAPIGYCPDISGQYIGLGESIKNKTTVPLVYELFMENHPLVRWQEVGHISIQQQEQNLLKIVAWKDNEVLYSANLSKDSDEFICEDGWLKIRKWTLRGIGMAMETSATSRSFTKADGYLLEKRESGGLLMLAILPIVSSSEEWFRFAPYEKSK